MFSKGSKLYSIFKRKCPRCQEGEFFVSTPYDLSKIGDIKESCSECGLKYEKEPGFYYGAMYVSYALGVATFVTCWVSMNLFFTGISAGWQIGIVIAVLLISGPYLFSLSKIIWANMFIPYNKNAKSDYQKGLKPHKH